jgi:hypothetical protein
VTITDELPTKLASNHALAAKQQKIEGGKRISAAVFNTRNSTCFPRIKPLIVKMLVNYTNFIQQQE